MRRIPFIVLSGIAMLAPSVVLAQGGPAAETEEIDTSDLDDLESLLGESVVTTASRSAERASTAPATVFTVTAREMQLYGIRTVDEALAYLGAGFQVERVRDYVTGIDVGAQGVLLRDLGRHILVMIDGHTMNAQSNGEIQIHEGLGVPLEMIDHLEVMVGAGSVMYGSNAVLAVINVVTRRARDGTGFRVVAELGLAAPMGEDGQPTALGLGDRAGLRYRLGLGAAAIFDFLGSPGEVVVHAEWLEDITNSRRIPELPPVGNLQPYPGEATWGGTTTDSMRAPSIVASLRLGDFRFSLQANHFDAGMPLVGTFDDPLASEERNAVRLDARHSAALETHVSLTSRIYADYTSMREQSAWTDPFWCLPGHVDGCLYRTQTIGRSVGLEQQLVVDWDLDGRIVTTFGYDLRARDATGRTGDYLDRVTGDEAWTTRLPYFHEVTFLGAIFAQQVWQPVEWLSINAGARLDIDSIFGARVSPRIATSVTPWEGASIRASYAEAFRAPTSYELEEIDPTYRIPAPALRPEVVRTIELEWQQRVAFVSFGLRGFVGFYEDFIATRVATEQEFSEALAAGVLASTAEADAVVRYDNLDTMRAFGGSLSFSMRPVTGLTLAGSITVVDSRIGEAPSPMVPTWLGNARVAFELSPGGAAVALAAAFMGRRTAYADPDLGFDTVTLGETLDLRATVSAPIDVVPGLRFRTSLGYTVNPFRPLILSAPQVGADDVPRALAPVSSSLFGFLGLQYDIDP